MTVLATTTTTAPATARCRFGHAPPAFCVVAVAIGIGVVTTRTVEAGEGTSTAPETRSTRLRQAGGVSPIFLHQLPALSHQHDRERGQAQVQKSQGKRLDSAIERLADHGPEPAGDQGRRKP